MFDPVKSGTYLYVTDDDDRVVESESAWEYSDFKGFAIFVEGTQIIQDVPIEAAYMAEMESLAFYLPFGNKAD